MNSLPTKIKNGCVELNSNWDMYRDKFKHCFKVDNNFLNSTSSTSFMVPLVNLLSFR